MKNSIYSTAAGMLTSAERLNAISNNLANIGTNGYKADIPFEQTIKFLSEGPYPGKDQPVIGGSALNMSIGNLKHTGQPLDLAVGGPGFFVVQGPDEQPLYTRNGSFTMNSSNELVTHEGFNVLDTTGNKINLYGNKVQIGPGGDITIDDAYFATIKLADLNDKENLEKVGSTFFKLKDSSKTPQDVTVPQVVVGSIEKSNVNLMKGMSAMIEISRTFELQKTTADVMFKLLRKTIAEVAKPI